MILEEVLVRVEKAFKNLKPEVVDFADYEKEPNGKPLIVIRVVAKGFENMRTLTRCRVLDDTLSQRDPQLYQTFVFVYECFTPMEYKMIKLKPNSRH